MKEYQGDEFKDATFKLTDSCAHCSMPITVELRNLDIASLDPGSVWIQQGGG